MLSLFQGVFDTSTTATSSLAVGDFLICLAAALVLGFVIALFYKYRTSYSKSFLVTLTLLPAIVSVIIMPAEHRSVLWQKKFRRRCNSVMASG